MSATIEQQAGVLQVTGHINFDTVLPLRAEGERYLGEASPNDAIVFDLGGAQCVDSSVLPLLSAWLRAGKSRQVKVQFRQVPEALQQIANVCGLLPWIN